MSLKFAGHGLRRAVLALLSLPLLLVAAPASADDLTNTPAARAKPVEDPASAAPSSAELTGKDIYQRVLDNTYESFVQVSSLTSGDRGGNEQWSRFKMWFKSEREKGKEPAKGDVVSKSRVQYTEPFDIRHSGYLVLSKKEETDDQFVYMPSQRRVKRVNLRGEAVFGTDFSFEDILPRELEDADYVRLPDEQTLGRECFVIEAVPNEVASSEYSRMIVHVDKERSIPVLTRYWDEHGIEVKELRSEPDSAELIDSIWIAKKMTMRHLKLQTYTRFELASIQPNAKLSDSEFELRRLQAGR